MPTPRARLLWMVVLFASVAASVRADLGETIPDDWFTRPPTPERLKVVQDAANDGWKPLAGRLFAGSMRAYELRQEDAASAWYYVARWCDLFGRSQRKAGEQWLQAMSEAGGLHRGIDIAKIKALPDEPLARMVSADTGAWLIGDRDFSETFFNQITQYDLMPGVVSILQVLRDADARKFSDYRQLAMAIALVYDSPPPAQWPHWQVSEDLLPRRLPPPALAFKFFTDADAAGKTLHKLSTIGVGELVFLVDLAASQAELTWAQQSVRIPLSDLVKSYECVRYRNDRIEARQFDWPGDNYALPFIYKEGGICVDQAYFATQAGKARGVPTLLFSGAGRDGRHAWFGYLGTGKKWVLDAGRYEDQRYVTGEAFDPQTWARLSDHELVFLSEGFRRLPSYRQSLQQQAFAEMYLGLKRLPEAAAAARKSVNYERRNAIAWDILIAANAEAPFATREALMREAARALQRYPDLAANYIKALAASMRARGAVSAAEFEERSLVRRSQTGGRTDMGVEQAAKMMEAASPAEQLRVYRQVLQQYGRDAGIAFYDDVTRPLLKQLIAEKRKAEAQQVIALTRQTLKPALGSQFDLELTELADQAK